MQNDELKQIKKLYGEEMMHLCRELFPSILETQGLLLTLLTDNIAPTKYFAKEVLELNIKNIFRDWINGLLRAKEPEKIDTDKTPFELMDEAGYILYECKTEEDIKKFKKYYAENEELCTFNGGRLNRCYVFFAVKKDVDNIKREDFKDPQRQDEYGTSVISIQFSKGYINTLSIKNRYNHRVNNPDATFSNNLDNIIPGLTSSFTKYYNYLINQHKENEEEYLFSNQNYVKANDNRYYHYNIESNGIYYCENNIIVKDGKVITKYHDNPERYIFADKYIIDLKEKTVTTFEKEENDSFVTSISSIGIINKITIAKDNNNKIITIHYEEGKEVKITINQSNDIIRYENNHIETINDFFLSEAQNLESISLKKVKKIGDYFISNNYVYLKSVEIPEVEEIGDQFLYRNRTLNDIFLPKVKIIGHCFMNNNLKITKLLMPELKEVGDYFLCFNEIIDSVSLPKIEKIEDCFLRGNEKLKSISLPKVKIIGSNFMYINEKLENIEIPEVISIGNNFLEYNKELKSIFIPKIERIGYYFLLHNVCNGGVKIITGRGVKYKK